MAFTLVEIRGRYTEGGVAAKGYVLFRRSATLQDAAGNLLSPNDERKATLDATGAISIQLEATDQGGVTPTGSTYTVTEVIRNKGRRVYSIEVPAASAGSGIELADVAPVTPGPQVFTYALQSTLDSEVATLTAADNTLQGNIDAEATARGLADDALSAEIAAKPDTFLELTDTPNAYTGQAAKAIIVNNTEDGLVFGVAQGGGGANLSDNTPLVESGAGSAGVGTEASRDDHVHPAVDLSGYATTSALSTETTNRTNADTTLTNSLNTHTALTTTAHGGIVASTDARLSDARTPTAHHTTHSTGGTDAIAPSDIGALDQTAGDARYGRLGAANSWTAAQGIRATPGTNAAGVEAAWVSGDTLPAAQFGSLSTGNNQHGVVGLSDSNRGVFGQSNSGTGARGISVSGIGARGTSTSGYGVEGVSDSSFGVNGTSTSSTGVVGSSTSGGGVKGSGNPGVFGENTSTGVGVQGDTSTGTGGLFNANNSGGTPLSARMSAALTNTRAVLARIAHRTTGTPAAGFGAGIRWLLQSTTTQDRDAGAIAVDWTDAADATRTSKMVLQTVTNAGALADALTLQGTNGTFAGTVSASNLSGTNTGDQTLPTDATIATTDVTTNNVSSTKHGWAPKSPADATQFLNGAATPAYAAVKDSDLSTSDITTNNVSTTKHGFAPKLPNDATKYLDGTGAYSVPAGGGGGGSGTVTSVAMTVPSDLSVSGSPITTSGTLAVTRNTQTANKFLAGPSSGSAAAPSYRVLAGADMGVVIPNLNGHPDAKPASPDTMDDEFDAGSLDAKWTKVNMAAVVTETYTGSHAIWSLVNSSVNIRGAYQGSITTGTWRCKVNLSGRLMNNCCAGMFLMESATSKCKSLSVMDNGGLLEWREDNWTNTTSFGSGTFYEILGGNTGYLEIQVDGTNVTFRVSTNGLRYEQIKQEAKTVAFTTAPDRIGLYVSGFNATTVYNAAFDWFRKVA